jgi:hypothetical protein
LSTARKDTLAKDGSREQQNFFRNFLDKTRPPIEDKQTTIHEASRRLFSAKTADDMTNGLLNYPLFKKAVIEALKRKRETRGRHCAEPDVGG